MASRKRLHWIASLFLVTALIVSGCGSGSGSGSSSGSGSGGSSAATSGAEGTEAEKPVHLEWLAYNSYYQGKVDNPIGEMVQERFNATFNVWYIDSNNWEENLNVRLGAGDLPDAMKIPSFQNIPKLVQQGILAPISREDFETYAPEYTKYIDEMGIWDYVTHNGEVYAIPTTNPDGEYPTAVVWNRTWLENVGINKIPETLEEYEIALTKFRNEDPDGNGQKDTYGMSDYAIPNILGAFGHPGIRDLKTAQTSPSLEFTQKDGKITFAAVQPEMKEALALLQKWYANGLIDPEFLTSEHTTGYWANSQAFLNGRIGLTGKGMFYHWRDEIDPNNPEDKGGGSYIEFKKINPDSEVVMGVPAIGPEGKSGTPQWDTASTPVGITTKAAQDPRKVQTILEMVEAAHTDFDYYVTLRRGIEGVDYELINGRYELLIDDPNNPKEGRGIDVFHVLVANDFYKEIQGAFLYDYADRKFSYPGYQAAYVPQVEAYQDHVNDLNRMTLEAYFKIITGEESVDYFDQYVSEFMAKGGEKILQEINEALQGGQ